MKRVVYYLFLSLLLISCAKEEFGRTDRTVTEIIGQQQAFTYIGNCEENFTLIKPPVDILFVFDNSTSTLHTDPNMKVALTKLLGFLNEERFDFHMLVAPLLRSTSDINQGASLAVDSANGLSASAQALIAADSGQILNAVSQVPTVPGSEELGFARAVELISHNRSNGIFRNSAYTIIVTLSSEDADWPQTGVGQQGPGPEQDDFNANRDALINLSNTMSANQFRYMSLVPKTDSCQQYFKNGKRYRNMSQAMYLHNVNTKPGFIDPAPSPTPDNFDICPLDFGNIFSQVQNSIQQVLLAHTYDHWLIAGTTDPAFDPQTIRAFKYFNDTTYVEIPETLVNGFEYIGFQTNQNTRSAPTPGEPKTGHFIRLNGLAQVTYPECMVIQTLAPAEYYAYVVATEEPDLSSVVFKKNGQGFQQSPANGWQYLGFQSNFNIKITAPGNYAPGSPALNRTGYVFRLNGNAVYSNGDNIELSFFPLPK